MSAAAFGAPPPPIAESKLFNAARRTVTLLVEAGVDQRFWRMHCGRDCHVREQGQGGREAALKELRRAREHEDAVLLAVLDADLDRVEDRLLADPDVVWTDAHDLETTLLVLPTLEKLVAQRVDAGKLADLERAWGESLRARLFRHAEGVGRLRWLKQREELRELLFKKSRGTRELLYFDKYAECVDRDWSPSLTRVIMALTDYSSAHHLRKRDLAGACAALPAADPAQICNGHDLVGFLGAWLRETTKQPHRDEHLTESLAGYCERAWLMTTAMWRAIQDWEQRHPGFQVLKTDQEHAMC